MASGPVLWGIPYAIGFHFMHECGLNLLLLFSFKIDLKVYENIY